MLRLVYLTFVLATGEVGEVSMTRDLCMETLDIAAHFGRVDIQLPPSRTQATRRVTVEALRIACVEREPS